MKTIIIYGSHHHNNTEKLVKHLASNKDIDLFDAEAERDIDLSDYDVIGFASGIDFGKFYSCVTDIAETLPADKRVFAIFTCGSVNNKMGERIREIAEKRNCAFLGKFGCKGYDSYGPFKLIGGINKSHPDSTDFKNAEKFLETILEKSKQ